MGRKKRKKERRKEKHLKNTESHKHMILYLYMKLITFQTQPLFGKNIGLDLGKFKVQSWLCSYELYGLGKSSSWSELPLGFSVLICQIKGIDRLTAKSTSRPEVIVAHDFSLNSWTIIVDPWCSWNLFLIFSSLVFKTMLLLCLYSNGLSFTFNECDDVIHTKQ